MTLPRAQHGLPRKPHDRAQGPTNPNTCVCQRVSSLRNHPETPCFTEACFLNEVGARRVGWNTSEPIAFRNSDVFVISDSGEGDFWNSSMWGPAKLWWGATKGAASGGFQISTCFGAMSKSILIRSHAILSASRGVHVGAPNTHIPQLRQDRCRTNCPQCARLPSALYTNRVNYSSTHRASPRPCVRHPAAFRDLRQAPNGQVPRDKHMTHQPHTRPKQPRIRSHDMNRVEPAALWAKFTPH